MTFPNGYPLVIENMAIENPSFLSSVNHLETLFRLGPFSSSQTVSSFTLMHLVKTKRAAEWMFIPLNYVVDVRV